ncbi:glycosyltransferase family 2 protein [Candidatus Beckwithbacteria bacterium]|nr:glycosyltransferase family 2 protein [Candidatus Beckwithbacteria bacterium]
MSKKRQENELISIIMPVYNAGDFLVEAIKSILDQTYTNWELIAVDDKSEDNSLQILKKFAAGDKRIKIITNRSNRGIGYSLNRALKVAKGTFIARMDADDIAAPKRLAIQQQFLKKHPKIIVCGGQANMIDCQGKVFAKKQFPTKPSILYDMIMQMIPIQHPMLMARAKYYKRYRYDESLSTAEDVDLLFYFLSRGPISNVSQYIYNYRKANSSNGYHNVKKTFYLTFLARWKAIISYRYQPSIKGVLISLAQLMAVTVLPSQWIVKLFEAIRFYPPVWQRLLAMPERLNPNQELRLNHNLNS